MKSTLSTGSWRNVMSTRPYVVPRLFIVLERARIDFTNGCTHYAQGLKDGINNLAPGMVILSSMKYHAHRRCTYQVRSIVFACEFGGIDHADIVVSMRTYGVNAQC